LISILVLILVLMFLSVDDDVLIKKNKIYFDVDHGGVEVRSC